MTRLATILREQRATYASVAARAHLQPRTIRQLATGEVSIDNVAVGTVRRIASALSVPVAELLEEDPTYPGDAARSRAERLSAAIREVMWSGESVRYVSPVESGPRDDVADIEPDEFFTGMPAVDADRG